MLGIGAATRVYLAVGATDMRKGFDGLYGLVQHRLKSDPLSGHLFLFCNRSRSRLKVLFWDGSGLWVCAKRLEKGRFCWPMESQLRERNDSGQELETKAAIDREELAMLLGGIDLAQTRRKRWFRLEPRGFVEAEGAETRNGG